MTSAHNGDRAEGIVEDSSISTETENLNKIRDILFGEQVSSQDRRFERLERQLEEECAHIRTAFDQKISALEDRLVRQVEAIAQKLETERAERRDDFTTLDRDLINTKEATERRTSQLDEKVVETARELQAELRHQTLTLRETLEQQIEAIAANLEREASQRTLSSEQERTKLSALFGQLSEALAEES